MMGGEGAATNAVKPVATAAKPAASSTSATSSIAKAANPFKISASLEGIFMIVLFAIISYVMVSHSSNKFESLTSPLTIITIIFLFAVFWGKIHLSLPMMIILIVLVIATMFQDKLKDWLNDWQNLFGNINNKIFQKTASKDLKLQIYQAFKEKWASTDGNTVKFTLEHIDQGAIGVPFFSKERWEYEYYLIITPDIISFEKDQVGDKKSEKITLWVAKHVAEVPVYVNGELYWVKTRAYLFRAKDPHLFLVGLFAGPVALGLLNTFNYIKYHKMTMKHQTMPYKDYQKFLKEVVMKNLVTTDYVFTHDIKWAL